jgi:hypothetical protein
LELPPSAWGFGPAPHGVRASRRVIRLRRGWLGGIEFVPRGTKTTNTNKTQKKENHYDISNRSPVCATILYDEEAVIGMCRHDISISPFHHFL